MPKDLKSWGAARDSEWLAAEDIDGLGDVPIKVMGVFGPEDKTINGKKKAACCWIEFVHAKTGRPLFDQRKLMTLNSARKKVLRKMFGTDPQACVGKTVNMYCVDTSFGGEELRGFRIRNEAAGAPKSEPAPMAPTSAREPGGEG